MARWKRNGEQIASDVLTQSKVCCICEERKNFSDFYNYRNKSDGKSYRCKSCDDLAREMWQNKNPDRATLSRRRNQLWTKYRLTFADYTEMLDKQKGGCAICGTDTPGVFGKNDSASFCVDHNHHSKKVRGLLCNSCNRGLGFLGDSPEKLLRAYQYISERH